jgi:histidinol-phosphatase (PHP family)
LIATFHNHSNWSDGQTDFGPMHAYAAAHGVDILGLSDHFCVYPDGASPDWSLLPAQARDYVDEVLSYRASGGMEVRVGAEFDWFEDHKSVLAPIVEALPLDYRIGSVHHVGLAQFDCSETFWSARSQEGRDLIFAGYWELIREMAESGLFDIAGHLDLPKKFGFAPGADMTALIDDALDAVADSGMAVELNTAGFGRPCADAYPSLDILRRCQARDIPVTLSADGHAPSHLLYEFEHGLARLREAGFTSIARFREREMWFEPLSQGLVRGR